MLLYLVTILFYEIIFIYFEIFNQKIMNYEEKSFMNRDTSICSKK